MELSNNFEQSRDGFSRLCQDWTTTFVTGLAREGDLQKNHACTCNTNVYKLACMHTPRLIKKNNMQD